MPPRRRRDDDEEDGDFGDESAPSAGAAQVSAVFTAASLINIPHHLHIEGMY